MQTVTLEFMDLRDLRRFVQLVNRPQMEVNYNSLTLICHCDDEEIKLAINGFNATVVKTHEPPIEK